MAKDWCNEKDPTNKKVLDFIRAYRADAEKIAKKLNVSVEWSLVQAVKRNIDRFPVDFTFQLSNQELERLRSQSVTSKIPTKEGRGGRRYPPYVFTEHGVAMLSSVLRSKRAVQINIQNNLYKMTHF